MGDRDPQVESVPRDPNNPSVELDTDLEYVFHEQIRQRIEWEFENANPQLLRNSIEEAVLAELPPIYKALCAGKEETAKLIQKQSKGVFEFVNSKGKITGMSALHWATILKQKKIVSLLCSTKEFSDDLVADVVDVHGKTPLDYSTDMEIMKELKRRDEVKYYVEGLYRDRQVYVDVSNAILGGAAMIAGITFEKWLDPPEDPGSEIFWISNNLAFFSAITTVLAGACTMFVPDSDITKAVTSIRKALKRAAYLLQLSMIFVVLAFTARFCAWPKSSFKYAGYMKSLIGGLLVCYSFMLKFARKALIHAAYLLLLSMLFVVFGFPAATLHACRILLHICYYSPCFLLYSLKSSFKYAGYYMQGSLIGGIVVYFIWEFVVTSSTYAGYMKGSLVGGILVYCYFMLEFARQLSRHGVAAGPKATLPQDSPSPSASTHTEGGQALAAGLADVVEPAYTLGRRHDYMQWDDGLDNLSFLPAIVSSYR